MYSMGTFIICTGAVLSLLLFLGFIVVMRYISYKETLSLAEKGLARPERGQRKGKGLLIWGIMVAAVGLALCLGLYPLGLTHMDPNYPMGLGPWMLAGLLPLFIGMGLILVYVIIGDGGSKKTAAPTSMPETNHPPVPHEPETVEEPKQNE